MERKRETKAQREKDRKIKTDRQKDTEKDRKKDRQREREGERDSRTHPLGGSVPSDLSASEKSVNTHTNTQTHKELKSTHQVLKLQITPV